METIGYTKARNLMRQLDWKMLVGMDHDGGGAVSFALYHPKQPHQYKIRKDCGKKLYAECRVIGSKDYNTAILCYDWDGSDESNI